MTSRGKNPQPDSPEDILRSFGYVVETWGVVPENEDYAEALQKALVKLDEYYTNKFLEIIGSNEELAWVKRGGLESHENIVNANALRQAIKQLSKRVKDDAQS